MRAGYAIKGGTAMSPEAWLPVAFVLGYLLGSIPFGLILTKLAGTRDLRSIGSGNIGATNVLRTGHKGLAAVTLICDMLKGTVAVVIAGYFGGPNAAMLAALGAFLGHLFPVWLKFRGGKGVAVYIGVLIGLFWPAAIVFCVVWAATAATSRYSSLSALVASAPESSPNRPITCTPTGNPLSATIAGMLTQGTPSRVQSRLKRGSPVQSSPFGAAPGAENVSNISISPKISANAPLARLAVP